MMITMIMMHVYMNMHACTGKRKHIHAYAGIFRHIQEYSGITRVHIVWLVLIPGTVLVESREVLESC